MITHVQRSAWRTGKFSPPDRAAQSVVRHLIRRHLVPDAPFIQNQTALRIIGRARCRHDRLFILPEQLSCVFIASSSSSAEVGEIISSHPAVGIVPIHRTSVNASVSLPLNLLAFEVPERTGSSVTAIPTGSSRETSGRSVGGAHRLQPHFPQSRTCVHAGVNGEVRRHRRYSAVIREVP